MRKMKDSGIEWIGNVPEEWVIIPVNYATTSRSGGTPDRNNLDYWENGSIPWMASGEVNKVLVYDTNEKITDLATKVSSAKIVPANSVMVALNGQGKTKGMSAVLKIDAACNQSLCAFQCNSRKLHYMYLFYCFQSMYQYLRFQAGDDVRDGLAASFVKKQRIPLPPLDGQKKIADFLDGKCADIDQIRADIEKQIEILTDYKKSVITEAVTKGLDPKAKMKDSGIKWIGKIPDTWNVIRLKNASWLKGRIGWQGLRAEEFTDEGPFLITGTDFKNGYVDWNTCVHISEQRFNQDLAIQIKENDLLITKDGTIGKLAIAKNCPEKVSLNSGVFIIRNTGKYKYDDKFMYYLLQSREFTLWFDLSNAGNSTICHLNQEKFYNFKFAYPSLPEQKKIADYLDEKCSEIDSAIEDKQKQLETLEEYKKSLIFEYVTGKKEVPA